MQQTRAWAGLEKQFEPNGIGQKIKDAFELQYTDGCLTSHTHTHACSHTHFHKINCVHFLVESSLLLPEENHFQVY